MGILRAILLSTTLYCSLAFSITSCRHPNEPDEPVDPDPVSFGSALQLDGVTDYIVVPHAPDLALSRHSFTIEAWVCPANRIYYKWIAAKATSNESLDYLLGFDLDGSFRFATRNLSNDITARCPNPYRWYHIAGVQDVEQGKILLYIDGKLQATTVLQGSPNNNTADLLLGTRIHTNYPQVLAEYLDADIDEIRIWNKALNHYEINTGRGKPLQGNENGLVAYWNFDEENGSAVFDVTNNGHDGTFGSSSSPVRIPSTVPIQ